MFGLFKKEIDNIELVNMAFDQLSYYYKKSALDVEKFRSLMPHVSKGLRFVCDENNIKLTEMQKVFTDSVQRTGIEKYKELASILDKINSSLQVANPTQIQDIELQKLIDEFRDICTDRFEAELEEYRRVGIM